MTIDVGASWTCSLGAADDDDDDDDSFQLVTEALQITRDTTAL